jgi:hypothetical protein
MLSLLALCAHQGCVSRALPGDPECSPSPGKAAAFDSSRAVALAGDYDLLLVSTWEREAGQSLRGQLHLEPTDSLHRSYEQTLGRQRRVDDRPLWGWATLSSKAISVPWSADPASHDPEHPGVLLHSTGRLELGVWRGMDGSSTNLVVQSLTAVGFAGRWSSDLGIVQVIENGRLLGNPNGYFCAFRR